MDAAFLAMGIVCVRVFFVAGRLKCRPVKSECGSIIETNVTQTRGEFHVLVNSPRACVRVLAARHQPRTDRAERVEVDDRGVGIIAT